MTKTVDTAAKPARKKIDWKTIEDLHFQGLLPKAISERTGVNARTISTVLCRRGINKLPPDEVKKRQEAGRGDRLKEKLGEITESAADVLLSRTPTDPIGLNLHLDSAQKAAKTASLLYGWGDGSKVAIIMPGVLTMKPPPEVIDVETVAEDDAETGENE